MTWICWFDDIGMRDVPSVGRNASLGEMRRALTPLGVRIPDGLATTADAYRAFLAAAGLEQVIEESLVGLDVDAIDRLQAAGARVRSAILAAALPPGVCPAARLAGHRQPLAQPRRPAQDDARDHTARGGPRRAAHGA
jgi:pyruvate,water dikinase